MIEIEMPATHTMTYDGLHFINKESREVKDRENPVIVMLYPEDDYAQSVAHRMGICMCDGIRKVMCMELTQFFQVAHNIAPNHSTTLELCAPLEEGDVRIVGVGYGTVIMVDHSTRGIFARWN